MLQLHPSDQQIYCLLRCDLYQGFGGTSLSLDSHAIAIEVILKIKVHDWNDKTTPTQNTTKQCVYIMGNTVHMDTASCMMTSSNENIFFVTGPLRGEFTSDQRPVTQSFDALFDMHLNKQLRKQWRRWWFETPLHSLWRHCNGKIWWCQYIILTSYCANNIIVVASGISPKYQSSRSLHHQGRQNISNYTWYICIYIYIYIYIYIPVL